MKLFLTYMFFLLLCTCVRAQVDEGFVLQAEEEGVRIYTREGSGGVLSVRTITRARTRVQAVKEVLDDAAKYPEWVHRCDTAYAIGGGDDFIFVSGIDMPFPFTDKQVVARVRQHIDDRGVFRRTITASPDAIPDDGERDRQRNYFGEWEIRPLTNGMVELQCTVKTDAGSGLPGWLRREILTGGPMKTLHNLKRRLEAAR